MTGTRMTMLDPASYRRSPWKNGGGVTIDIADAYRPGAPAGDWAGMIWRFGATTIASGAPFSDLAGFDRVLMVVTGSGLVLGTPAGDLDVRAPLRPVRFGGETPIVSRLEAGPVEVVNLIGDRAAVAIDMTVLPPGDPCPLGAGIHLVYAPGGPVALAGDDHDHALAARHTLRLDVTDVATVRCRSGVAILASIARA